MKLRHAAVLALVGWYLMMRPWRPALDVSAPLSKWVPYKEFFKGYGRAFHGEAAPLALYDEKFRDSSECREFLSHLKAWVKKQPQDALSDADQRFEPSNRNFSVMVDRSVCIEDDDPRLKGNVRYRRN